MVTYNVYYCGKGGIIHFPEDKEKNRKEKNLTYTMNTFNQPKYKNIHE